MKEITYSLLLFIFSTNLIFAEKVNNVAIVPSTDSTKTDSSNFVKSGILFMERDKSNTMTYFGHIALRLQCPSVKLDYVFTFESNQTGTLYERIMGLEKIALIPVPINKFLEQYSKEGRDVYEYPLNLTLEENRNLWRLIDRYIKKGPYLPNDYLNTGCAQETASMILSILNGHLVYDNYINEIGTTQRIICKRLIDKNSWFCLFLFMFSSNDCDRYLNDDQRLFIPSDMIEAWKNAKIQDNEGNKHSIFKSTEPTIYKASAQKATPSNSLSTMTVFGIILVIILVISVLQLVRPKINAIANIIDGTILVIVSIIALALGAVYSVSHIPAVTGWCHSFVVFNPIPLIIYLISKRNKFSGKTWMKIYAVYSIILLLQVLWMLLNQNKVDPAEFLIVGSLTFRCMTKIIINKRYV